MSMKKHLLLAAATLTIGGAATSQVRYLDETFPNVTVSAPVEYGQNYHFFPFHDSPITPGPGPYAPTVGPMRMKVYTPTGDVATNRPLVILVHTGNFLPQFINGSTTGDYTDSALVELATRFAKRGYVAATPRYRLGWNPLAGSQIERTKQLLNAVYRAILDVQTCVRSFKDDPTEYNIDPSKIVLMGLGSGGYVVNAYTTLDKQSETALPKFLDTNGVSVINPLGVGDVNGSAALYNQVNYPGVNKDVAMSINLGGALGDISWLEAGDVPTLGFHTRDDQFAPYDSGTVIVPTTQEPVVFVHGTRTMIKKAVALGNNNVILNRTYLDPVSARAYSMNPEAQFEGLFEFRRPITAAPFEEASPWDWWDSTTAVSQGAAYGVNPAGVASIHASGKATNPDMSAAKGRRYIDTVMWYSIPRIMTVLDLPGNEVFGINNASINGAEIALYPNPVSENFTITVTNQNVQSVTLIDINGKTVQTWNNLNTNNAVISRGSIAAGLYLVKIKTAQGEASRQVIFK
jgi:hypothetical protein